MKRNAPSSRVPRSFKRYKTKRRFLRWPRSKNAYGDTSQSLTRLADPYPRIPLGGLETSKMVHMRYADVILLNASATSTAHYTFSANGMYDPNVTGTGHQPNGFDQLMGFFNHYTVVDSTIRVAFAPTTGSNIVPGFWDVLLTDDATLSVATPEDLMESREGTGMAYLVGSERGYIGQSKAITRKFNAKRFFAKSSIVGDALYRGNASSNPTEQAFFTIVHADVFGNDPAPTSFSVVIDYLAVLTEPKPQLAS